MNASAFMAFIFVAMTVAATAAAPALADQEVELQTLGRFDGWRDNPLIGTGLVVGLAGSGDSTRSDITRQALVNTYGRLGLTVPEDAISSRNVAVVIVSARLPASANVGDQIDVTVSSAADARSLAGGVLLMTPMMGPDGQAYALAQGPLLTGGFGFDSQLNVQQRNYPTTARIEGGATVEAAVNAQLLSESGQLRFLLDQPSHTTAARVSDAINARFQDPIAVARNADEVTIRFAGHRDNLTRFVAEVENLRVAPERLPRIVINERTGTVVAGGDVTISSVVISQGDIRVSIIADTEVSQPFLVDAGRGDGVRSLTVTNTDLEVVSGENTVVASFPNTAVADLIQGLSEAQVDTRRIISILQAIKAAGALNAEIVVQ